MSIETSEVDCVFQEFGMSEDLQTGDDEADDLLCRLWVMDFQGEMAGKRNLKEFRKWNSGTIMGVRRERSIFLDFPCSTIDFRLPRLAPFFMCSAQISHSKLYRQSLVDTRMKNYAMFKNQLHNLLISVVDCFFQKRYRG